VGEGFEFKISVANHITTNQFQNDDIIKWYKTGRGGGEKGKGGLSGKGRYGWRDKW